MRLRRAARRTPVRRVLALSVQRPENAAMTAAIGRELQRSRHQVELRTSPAGELGKFENLNRLLALHPAEGHDWLLVLDDDVKLPRGFLDDFVFLCERFSLALAQPAHRLRSHAAWPVTRRHPGSVVRETGFVEIGPVSAFAAATFPVLLPFPPLRMGWGLDTHWAALARRARLALRRRGCRRDRAPGRSGGLRLRARGRPGRGSRLPVAAAPPARARGSPHPDDAPPLVSDTAPPARGSRSWRSSTRAAATR